MKGKRIAIMLTAVLAAAAVTPFFGGCKPATPNDEFSLEIYATGAGFGLDWIEDLIPVFEEQNEGAKVYFNYDVGVELCRNKVEGGPNVNTADLMISLEDWQTLVLRGKNGVVGYDYALEDLTDLLDEEVDGEPLRDKFLPYTLDVCAIELETSEGVYEYRDFVVPWATSYSGIVYNKTLFDAHPDWKLPRTTDEMLDLTGVIKGEGVIPFVNETKTGYIDYMTQCLFAQYLGIDEYYDYYAPITEEDGYKYAADSEESKARLYAMFVMNDLLNPDNGRLSETAEEDDYGRAQGRLISGEGAMAIMGDWFDKEMSITIEQAHNAGNNYESGMISTPVLSALSEKLSYWETIMSSERDYAYFYNNQGTEGKENLNDCDKLLAKIVDYVDNGEEGELPSVQSGGRTVTATEGDVDIVREARSCYSSLGSGHTMVIPSYASAKELAKKFIQLLFSETGIQTFLSTTSGGSLPVKYDVTQWSGYENATDFQKEVYALTQKGNPVQHPASLTWRITGLPDPSGKKFYQYGKNDSSYISPQRYLEMDSLTQDEFLDLMTAAGLL